MVHHSDRGSPYLSIHHAERLAEAAIDASVGGVGESYDNVLAETIIGLYNMQVIDGRGPWRTIDAVEYTTLERVDLFNHRRLRESIGHVPSTEYEQAYHRNNAAQAMEA